MSDFFTTLDEYYGASNTTSDIRVVARPLFFYDFNGAPIRIWRGQGTLITSDNLEWWGTIDAGGNEYHNAPALQDGRDGTSATYEFTLDIPQLPGQETRQTYEQLKSEQWRVNGRSLWCYWSIFLVGEALRPSTPYIAFKELTMFSPKFSERVESTDGKSLRNKYSVSIVAKDANYGRVRKPNGTYSDTMQKRRAAEQGIALDRGCEFVATLANRTYTLP